MLDRSQDHLRLGDAEREQASARLRDHYAEGRLDTDEYSERLDAVWAARTRADLRPVFADLPGSTPEARRASAYAAPHRPSPLRFLVPLLLVVALVTIVTHLPFLLLALLVLWVVLHRRGPRQYGPRQYGPRRHYGWR